MMNLMIFKVNSLLRVSLMLRGRLRRARVDLCIGHYSKICFIVMLVWHELHIGDWSLLIRKECVKNVWPTLKWLMVILSRLLKSGGKYHRFTVLLIDVSLLVGKVESLKLPNIHSIKMRII
jgi:hypothetical protein